MTSLLERISRLASPATLLLALVAFALPFCALSCNASFVGAGTVDVVQASGISMVVGGDVSPDCASLQKLSDALSKSFGGTSGSGSTSISSSSDCAKAGSTSTSTSTSPSTGAAGSPDLSNLNQQTGPFGPSTSAGRVHVNAQPLAVMAVVLLVLGIALTAIAGRIRAMVSAAVALGAVASLIALRLLTASNFTTDVNNQSAAQQGSSSGLGLNLKASDVIQLTWGLGWLLAVILAGVAVVVNALALLPTGAGAASEAPAPYVPTQAPQAWGQPPPPPPGPPAEPWGPPPPGPPAEAWGAPPDAPAPAQPAGAESGRTQSFMPQRTAPPAEPTYGFGRPPAPPVAPAQPQPWDQPQQAPQPAPWEQQPPPPGYPPEQ